MTRGEGRRGIGERRDRGGASVLLFLSFLLLMPQSSRVWAFTIGGRFGLEVDGLGEEYQTSGLFDQRVLSDGSIEILLEEKPVRSRDTALLGLLELRSELGSPDAKWIRVIDTGRLGNTRRRNSLNVEGGLAGEADRVRLEGQWDSQGGEDEPAAGSQGALTGSWDRDSLPGGLRSQLRLGADWSHSTNDTLAAIFEYRVLRAQMQLRRDLARDLELRTLFGYRHKDAFRSTTGSYDSRYAEVEMNGSSRDHGRLDALLRYEDRSYATDTLGIPSSREYAGEVRYERRTGPALRPYTEHRYEWQDYDRSSGIFQDHRQWKGEIGTDLFWSGLRGGSRGAQDLLTPDWRIRLGAQAEVFRVGRGDQDSLSFTTSYDRFGGLFGISLEGNDVLWLDLSMEIGHRDYRGQGAGGSLTFEGLNFSLASSDFTYLRASAVAQWTPVPWLRQEVFLHWDEELHEKSSDDFRLWILNISLTHPF